MTVRLGHGSTDYAGAGEDDLCYYAVGLRAWSVVGGARESACAAYHCGRKRSEKERKRRGSCWCRATRHQAAGRMLSGGRRCSDANAGSKISGSPSAASVCFRGGHVTTRSPANHVTIANCGATASIPRALWHGRASRGVLRSYKPCKYLLLEHGTCFRPAACLPAAKAWARRARGHEE